MRRSTFLLSLLVVVSSVAALTGCTSASRKHANPSSAAAVGDNKVEGRSAKAEENDLDEYSAALVADPLERVNRGIFWLNDGIYTILLRPISKGYETVLPKLVRQGIDNVFENVRFPIRLINSALQGNFNRARQELEKFLINTTIGIGGLIRQSDRVPSLADVPTEDTGQTFAKWGIDHGPYIVLPVLGPSSLRDAVGLVGDYALNPLSWVSFLYGGHAWFIPIPTTNTVRALPGALETYDSATKDALDRYIAARTSYIQYRREAAVK
jgi:phospholipid-binding lipoprotein MlaA